MSITKKFSLKAPVDPEINIKVRETLDYYITFPNGYDKSKKYGLVFCISGYGDTAASEYQSNKLRPYISDKYNMITVGVRYHNDLRTNSSRCTIELQNICNFYELDSNYFKDMKNGDQLIDKIFKLLVSRKIFSLDPRVALKQLAYQ